MRDVGEMTIVRALSTLGTDGGSHRTAPHTHCTVLHRDCAAL